jgi:flagellin
MGTAMERLSTGKRINSASDDAAGLAIASRMASQVKGLEQASRNANDAISMIQTVEGAGKEILNILSRMKELAVQSRSETYSDDDRTALNEEYTQLRSEIERVQENTSWNGMALMDGDKAGADLATRDAAPDTKVTLNVQVGSGSNQIMAIEFKSWDLAGDDPNDVLGVDISGSTITNTGNANTALGALDTAIQKASAELATYGSYMNRLEYASDNLLNVAQNTDASRSRIEDADYASETSELAKTQIIAQAGTAMLAQANQIKQTVLALLQ